jgi:lipopolysaccharide/colanic/teichoic acid biosynthesis glycosyltransferase
MITSTSMPATSLDSPEMVQEGPVLRVPAAVSVPPRAAGPDEPDPMPQDGGTLLDPDAVISPLVASPGARSLAKRIIDVTGAVAGLVLLSPLMLVIAVLIRLDSPGPIFFRQRRMGLGGKVFWFLKFRTMAADAEHRIGELEALNEAACGVLFKIRRDPRVTPLGRVLRRSSLDELPQLLNVLRGEMSLVGPRPLQMRDCERLEQVDPDGFALRLTVLPGLTGAWQVGGRSETDCQGMMRLDLDYVERWSLALDLQILCKTVGAVLRGRGAY